MAPPNSAAIAARFEPSSYRHLTCNVFTNVTVVDDEKKRVGRDLTENSRHFLSINPYPSRIICGSHQIKASKLHMPILPDIIKLNMSRSR